MDPTTGEFRRFRHVADDSTSLSQGIVRDIHHDRRGRLWIGTDGGGLNLCQPSDTTFRGFSAALPTLTRDNVWAIEKDRSGTLWIATYEPRRQAASNTTAEGDLPSRGLGVTTALPPFARHRVQIVVEI